jgi:TM2 domain-containing membrane protein YozV
MKKITSFTLASMLGIFMFTSCSTENLALKKNYNTLGIAQQSTQVGNTGGDKMATTPTTQEPVFVASTEKGISGSTLSKPKMTVSTPKAKSSRFVTSFFKKSENKQHEQQMAKKPFTKKQIKAANSGKAGSNWIVALLLCFFLGMLGVHRFYLGYIGIGFIQLGMFLLGFLLSFVIIGIPILIALSIWVLIDFIRIILKKLEPKDGSYS